MSSSRRHAPAGDNPGVRFIEIDDNQHGQRLDNFLSSRLKGVPRSRIYRIIRKGEVRVNARRVKPAHKLQTGDTVRVPPVRTGAATVRLPTETLTALVRDSILYEDDSLLVVNKPSGLPVHAGTGVKADLITTLRHLYPDQWLELAHRLDKGTSGCIMVAKSAAALKRFQTALKGRDVEKRYHVLVHGQWPEDLGEVGAALQRQPARGGDRRVAVAGDGRNAATRFRVLERFPSATLVEAMPLTGRTHQIRVHAMHAGHPVCGDDKYGSAEMRRRLRDAGSHRLCLHARRLTFSHPARDLTVDVTAPYDEQFAAALEQASRR